jgi:hypothetical protein
MPGRTTSAPRSNRCEHGALLAEFCEACWQEACDFDGDDLLAEYRRCYVAHAEVCTGVAHAEQGEGAG